MDFAFLFPYFGASLPPACNHPSTSSCSSYQHRRWKPQQQPMKKAIQVHADAALSLPRPTLARVCPPADARTVATVTMPVKEELICEKEAAQPTFNCVICLTDYKVDGCCTLPCEHRFCFDCLQCYFHGIVHERRLNQLVCPAEGCNFDLRPSDYTHILQQCLPEDSYHRLVALLACELPCICQCRHSSCQEFVFVDDEDDPTNLCCPRGHTFCRSCEGGPHPGLSCEEQKQHLDLKRSHEDRENENREQKAVWESALALGWKPCPRRCAFGGGYKAATECDHVTCQCGFQFCWDCGADRSVTLAHDNRWHKPSCRYHTKPADVKDKPERSAACPECQKLPSGMVCAYPADDGYPATGAAVPVVLNGRCARKPVKKVSWNRVPRNTPRVAEKTADRAAAFLKIALHQDDGVF